MHAMAVLRLAAAEAILSLIIGVDGKTDKARTLIMRDPSGRKLGLWHSQGY